jgi:hypothetical protein
MTRTETDFTPDEKEWFDQGEDPKYLKKLEYWQDLETQALEEFETPANFSELTPPRKNMTLPVKN